MNICGKLSAVPLLDPPNDEILEIGTLYGMFGAALIRMMGSARDATGVYSSSTRSRASSCSPAPPRGPTRRALPVRGAAVRANLALVGAAGAAARVQQGFSEDPEARALVPPFLRGDHR